MGSPVSAGVKFRRVKTTLAGSVYRPSASFPPTCIHLQLIAWFICTWLFQTNECLHLEEIPFPLFTFPSLRFLSVFSSGCPSPSLSFIHLFSLSVSRHFTPWNENNWRVVSYANCLGWLIIPTYAVWSVTVFLFKKNIISRTVSSVVCRTEPSSSGWSVRRFFCCRGSCNGLMPDSRPTILIVCVPLAIRRLWIYSVCAARVLSCWGGICEDDVISSTSSVEWKYINNIQIKMTAGERKRGRHAANMAEGDGDDRTPNSCQWLSLSVHEAPAVPSEL